MTIRIGGVVADDAERFLAAMSTPFAFDIDPDNLSKRVEEFLILFEPERARCAFDGSQIVGTLGAFTLPMTIPGGTTSVAGTTMVTVLPSHRRRGALRGMISAHFDDARARGESLAALWASDSAIYHRFGYGMASVFADVTIDREHNTFHRLSPDTVPVRMVAADEILDLARPVYNTELGRRPGMYGRNDGWWQRRLRDRSSERDGATAFRYAIADGRSGPDGYVQYRLKAGRWDRHHGDGEIRVRELIARTPEAAASLWTFVLGHDLTASITAGNLPEDDRVFSLLDGWRRSSPRILDQMWVRILELDEALDSRRYAVDGVVTLAVHDPTDQSVLTRRLEVDGGVGSASPHTGDADIQLDIEDLGAAYLGRSRFRQLAAAGRVTGTPEALALADRMFSWDPAPWCQETF